MWVFFLMLSALLFVSCDKESAQIDAPATRTVLVYLAGDNNISASVSAVVETLRGGWRQTNSNCLIYLDAVDAPPKLLRLNGGNSSVPLPYVETIEEYPEENSASGEVLARVIAKVRADYPAPIFGLIVASHASGWLPEGALANPVAAQIGPRSRSIGADGNTGTTLPSVIAEMELSDFANAIPDHAFDFIIFEACLMAGVEVAYELKDKTTYILASSAELLVPGFVPIYKNSQQHLFDNSISVEEGLIRFARDYYNHALAQSGAYRSATLSVIKTDEIKPLADLLKGVNLSTEASIYSTQHFDRPGSYGDTPALPRYFDLLHAAKQLLSQERYQAVETQIKKTVVWKVATPTILWGHNGILIEHHSGLTTYIEQEQLSRLNQAYRETAWYRDTR